MKRPYEEDQRRTIIQETQEEESDAIEDRKSTLDPIKSDETKKRCGSLRIQYASPPTNRRTKTIAPNVSPSRSKA